MKNTKTGAGTWTILFNVSESNKDSLVVSGGGMGSDTIPLEFSHDGGTTWIAVSLNGTPLELSVDNTHFPLNMLGHYRLQYTGSEAGTTVTVQDGNA